MTDHTERMMRRADYQAALSRKENGLEPGPDDARRLAAGDPDDERYPVETLDENDDNGTMPENVDALRAAVVGHKIVSVEQGELKGQYCTTTGLILTLDDGRKVQLLDSSDCCAYTQLETFLKNVDMIDHVITGVGTTDGYTKWHIYADMGDVLELTVGWSSGNPFYYGYGFEIRVIDAGSDYALGEKVAD